MPSNYTENYQLSQWSKDDQVKMEDFNADNAKIDAAIKGAVTRFAIGTYQGTGESGEDHPNVLTFDFQPKVVIVQSGLGAAGILAIFMSGLERTHLIYSDRYGEHRSEALITSWSGNTVSWYLPSFNYTEEQRARIQANDTATYHYIAIG